MASPVQQDYQQKTSLGMILEGNASNKDILDQLEKIEALEQDDPNRLYHEYTKISGWPSYQIHAGLTSAS
jgi:hypothetical protein